jgi:hypothetical protein
MSLKMLLTCKPKTGIDEFCQKFYDTNIFHSIIAGIDSYMKFCEFNYDQIMKADSRFATIDHKLFRIELTAVHMELFSLAWTHCRKFKRDEYLLRQTNFTKSYLEREGQQNIWNIMLEYNKAIADSLNELVGSIPIDSMRRGKAVFLNTFRLNLFEEWMKVGIDKHCAIRILSRLFTENAWSKKITLKHITAQFAERLKIDSDLDAEAIFRLSVVLYGLYNGARDAIRSVKLQF